MSTSKRIGVSKRSNQIKYLFYFVLAGCFVCGFLASAQAQISGEALLGLCQTALQFEGLPEGGTPTETEIEDLTKKTLCWGYLYGVSDTATTWQETVGNLFCLPEGGAQVNQTVSVVVKYLEDNPEDLHYRADSAVQLALRKAFPCTEGGE